MQFLELINTEKEELENKTLINWDNYHLPEFDQEITLKHLLHYNPDKKCYKILKEVLKEESYHGFTIQTKSFELMFKALSCSYDELEKIRHSGIPTHAIGHARAFQFKKCFENFQMMYYHSIDSRIFIKIIERYFDDLEKSFNLIFETLTHGFEVIEENYERNLQYDFHFLTKREKDLLVRAFWKNFSSAWNEFSSHDWFLEYKSFWLVCLDKLMKLMKEK